MDVFYCHADIKGREGRGGGEFAIHAMFIVEHCIFT